MSCFWVFSDFSYFSLVFSGFWARLGSCFSDFSSFSYFFQEFFRLFRCGWGAVLWISLGLGSCFVDFKSSPNLCVNSSFSYVVLSTLLLSSRDLTEWSLVYHNTLSYQRFYDLHSIHYDHLEGLHQLI